MTWPGSLETRGRHLEFRDFGLRKTRIKAHLASKYPNSIEKTTMFYLLLIENSVEKHSKFVISCRNFAPIFSTSVT